MVREREGWGSGLFLLESEFSVLKELYPPTPMTDDWEVPFEAIRNLQWLGSGAQGAVFLGQYRGEPLAVKKLREEKETDIKHLRKLNHPNIVKIK